VDCINGNDASQNFEILAGYDSGKAAVPPPSKLLKARSASSESFQNSAGYSSSTSEDCDVKIEPSAEIKVVQKKRGENQSSPILESQQKDLPSSESSASEADEPECEAGQNVESGRIERPPSNEEEDAEEEEDPSLGLTPRVGTVGEMHRKPTPVQSRTGWETDESAETATAFDAQLSLGPPSFSPRGRLRWATFGDMACSPRSPVTLQRETSGGAFRPCTIQPCSPMGDAGLPWDVSFPSSLAFE